MMNKEQLNILMKKIDKTKKPKHWRKFINNNVETHKYSKCRISSMFRNS